MNKKEKYYRTLVTFEVLSDEPIDGSLSLTQIEREIESGRWSGSAYTFEGKELCPMEMAEALEEQASDPDSLLGEKCRTDQPHLQFEYDPKYTGGGYSNVGLITLIPLDAFLQFESYEEAFQWWTGLDPIHVVCFDESTEYTHEGEPWHS